MNPLPSASTSVSKVDVLAIDDNLNNLLVICGMLKDRGYRVRPATSGRLGLEAAETVLPDVILLDICMPEMDGYEVCQELKRREHLKEIPVIFLSALGESVDKVRAFESGGYDYVTKPFKIEEVVARIDTHVTIRRLRLDLQRRYEELKESERLREKLTHLIVHDLRNPLGVIQVGLDFALHLSAQPSEPVTVRVLETAFSQVGVVNRMIDDMLDISRFEGGKMPLHIEENSIPVILEEARAAVAIYGQHVSVDLSEAAPSACLDRELVRRVLTNLFGNAVKFTPAGGEIRITVRSTPWETRFEVHDSGTGISPEHHERIFEKFGQVDTAQPGPFRSTGLGLTFCKLAVEAHGGRIGVESEVGKGSVFWFTLPNRPAELSQVRAA
jgi:two-component system, sensor histidine kinase and response regulator